VPIHLTPAEQRIVHMLASSDKPLCGADIHHRARDKIPRGTVYVLLERLTAKGVVTSSLEKPEKHVPGRPRRFYELTKVGKRAAKG
jgi:DNA-binding PadR family transcriptional regulator